MRNNASWMKELNSVIGDTPLNELIVPGSHDSGTKNVSCPFWVNDMARCQNSTIAQQLDLGIRFLDFYVNANCLILGAEAQSFTVYHGPCTTKLTANEVTDTINDFLNRSEASQEIVIARFAKLTSTYAKPMPSSQPMSTSHQYQLLKILTGTKSGGVNPLCAKRPEDKSIGAATGQTVNELLAKNDRFIILFDYEDTNPAEIEKKFPVWCNKEGDSQNGLIMMDEVWQSDQHVNELVGKLAQYQAYYKSQFWDSSTNSWKKNRPMFALQAILTVNGATPLGARSIEEFSQDSNQYLMDWIANQGVDGYLNVLLLNFVDENYSTTWNDRNYVEMSMDLNRSAS